MAKKAKKEEKLRKKQGTAEDPLAGDADAADGAPPAADEVKPAV